MMQKNYTFGIIGAGMIAEKHILSLRKTGRVNIKWVARKDSSRLKEFQEKFEIPKGTDNYKDVLSDSEVDAVVITSPPHLHFKMFSDAIDAGKHILLEKPAALTKKDLDRMLKLQEKYPKIKVCDCSCRHARLQPKFKTAKEIVDSGVLGDIYFIHHNAVARQSRPGIEYHPSAKWFLNKALAGGGPVFDWGVYDLSFHLGLLSDKPKLKKTDVLFMKSGLDDVDPGTDINNVEEHFAVSMRFSGGLKYYWERSTNANMEAQNETRIYGTKAGLKLSFCTWDPNKIELFDVENEGKGKARSKTIEVDTSKQDDDFELANHFINVLDEKEKPAMPLELAARHMKIIYDIYENA